MPTYRLGELFCGPGGIAWGAMNADIGNPDYRIVHQWANDYDGSTCKTYTENICKDRPETVFHEDIRKFNMNKLAPIDEPVAYTDLLAHENMANRVCRLLLQIKKHTKIL